MVSSLARLVDGGQDNLYSQTRPTTLKRTKDGFKVVYCHRLVQSLWITTETHIYSFPSRNNGANDRFSRPPFGLGRDKIIKKTEPSHAMIGHAHMPS
jgi:hypothetical protein